VNNEFPEKISISEGYDKLPEEMFMPVKFHNLCIDQLSYSLSRANIVADFGCGHGKLLELLSIRFPGLALIGCDISKVLCGNARAKVPKADIRTADLEDMPFEDNSIDCGFATEVLEHMETPVKALREMHRVLKANSVSLVSLPNRDWFRFNEYIRNREKFQPVDDKFYSVSEMEEYLRNTGFKVLKVRGGENLYFGGGIPRLLEKLALLIYPPLHRKMKRMIIVSEVIK